MRKFSYVLMGALTAASIFAFSGCGSGEIPDNVVMDEYKITIACQSDEGEQVVLEKLIAAYEKKNPDVQIELETFTGQDFEVFMNGVSQDEANSPNIIWTSDSYHARWEQYFTDLRPFYERSAETDYSLYYESMLDTAAINGKFKPTKNYKGSFRSDDLDTSDGLEEYYDHSQYGIYFAPRDYNKPTILCNTALLEMLDTQYETYYKSKTGASAMPADYVSTTVRLNDIVAGNDWNELTDLFTFSKTIADRIQYVISYADSLGAKGQKVKAQWQNKTVLDLKLDWEPSYVTILNAMGVDNIIASDGTLNLSAHKDALEELHGYLYAQNNLYYAGDADTNFKDGDTLMKVVSRPALIAAEKNLSDIHKEYYNKYNKAPLQAIQIPTDAIAAGCSGYAINSIYHGKTIEVKGVKKTYDDLCWDFLKFVITEEGQEIAGATGNNIPILKSLYTETKDGGTPAWRSISTFAGMDHDAWATGDDLVQNWYNIYKSNYRIKFRDTVATFFRKFKMKTYSKGSLTELIKETNDNYNAANPKGNLR